MLCLFPIDISQLFVPKMPISLQWEMFVYTRGWNIDLCQNDDAIDAKIIWINEQVSVNERTSGTIE